MTFLSWLERTRRTGHPSPRGSRPAGRKAYRPTTEALEGRVLLSADDISFQNARRDYETPASYLGITSADFNGDLVPDVAAVTDTSASPEFASRLIIRLGRANGTLGPLHIYVVGGRPADVIAADFNGDAVLDLAVANSGSGTVSVLLGNGNGTFQAVRNFGVQQRPEAVVVGDFNRDGRLDLAVANYDSKTVSILRGNGDGTFQPAQHLPTAGPFGGASPTAIVVSDLNGDSVLDLVAGAIGNYPLSVYMGNGDGTFQAARALDAGPSPSALAVGDFNGDRVPDLAVGSFASAQVFILLGLGDGNFGPPRGFAAGPDMLQDIAVADFNGDQVQDLVVANWLVGAVSILTGNGDGTFQPARPFPVGGAATAVAVADFNRDGRTDVVAGASFQISLLLGDGQGGLLQAPTYAVGPTPTAVVVADFNRDGRQDVAATSSGSASVAVLLGRGDGTFTPGGSFAVGGGPNSLGVADFNRDGIPDLATANGSALTVSVLRGNGDGTFAPALHFPGLEFSTYSLTVGDFNGDALPDVAVLGLVGASYNLGVLLGNGDGTLRAPIPRNVGNLATSIAAGDFNRDGISDLASEARDTQNRSVVTIFLGNGDGTFRSAGGFRLVNTRDGSRVRVTHVNTDAIPDLLVSNGYRATVYVALGNGDGTFRLAPNEFEGVLLIAGVVNADAADFNGDGVPDLAAVGGRSNFYVRFGNNDGTFRGGANFGVGDQPRALAVGDFDGDLLPDVAVVNSNAASVSILINEADGRVIDRPSDQAGQPSQPGGNPSGAPLAADSRPATPLPKAPPSWAAEAYFAAVARRQRDAFERAVADTFAASDEPWLVPVF